MHSFLSLAGMVTSGSNSGTRLQQVRSAVVVPLVPIRLFPMIILLLRLVSSVRLLSRLRAALFALLRAVMV